MAAEQIDLRVSLGDAQAAIEKRLAQLDEDRYLERLWLKDPSLWSDDPEHQKVARNRLGWLDSPAAMQAHTGELREFAAEIHAAGFTHAVLLGMGGSSLAPEVFRKTYGVAKDGVELTVLDNTSPAAVRAIAESHDPEQTLFIVSSKSGGTIEVRSFEAYFYEWVRKAKGTDAGSSFVAVTDPGTSLQDLAKDRGYRRAWTNPPDIGGRYSALSFFGLVPAALIGVDLDALLASAVAEAHANGAGVRAESAPAVRLGAILGELGRIGRDKVILHLEEPFEAFASWAEQLIAESTGKSGRGLVPVADPVDGGPMHADRVFVAFSRDTLSAGLSHMLDDHERAEHPTLRWRDGAVSTLGAEFLRWEIATVVASSILGVDPFDEPNVAEAKQATAEVLDARVRGESSSPGFAAADSDEQSDLPRLAVEASRSVLTDFTSVRDPSLYPRLLAKMAQPGDYIAILAYMHRTPELERVLRLLRVGLFLAGGGVTTTLGYGPRFLHSTGQLHKGGANNGLFIQLIADEDPDVEIPKQQYGFSALRASQSEGDFKVLDKRGRRAIRVRLYDKPESAITRICMTMDELNAQLEKMRTH